MINIYIFGKCYSVPENLTIMRAMEFSGIKLVHGCGCRNGFCGACLVLCRKEGEDSLKTCLACRTRAENNMHVCALPDLHSERKSYNIEEIKSKALNENIITQLYPEVNDCIGCNLCTKSCVQGIDVMKYIAYAKSGETEKCAAESFDCIMCGGCSLNCPAHIPHRSVGMLARRLNGKYLAPQSKQLKKRVEEIKNGQYNDALENLKNMSREETEEVYDNRTFLKNFG